MGSVPIFAITTAIPIHATEKNRNHPRNSRTSRKCEWTLSLLPAQKADMTESQTALVKKKR